MTYTPNGLSPLLPTWCPTEGQIAEAAWWAARRAACGGRGMVRAVGEREGSERGPRGGTAAGPEVGDV